MFSPKRLFLTIITQQELRLGDADDSNYTGLRSPATVASNLVFDLMGADGNAGQFVKTDGSKVLSFDSPAMSLQSKTATSSGQTVFTFTDDIPQVKSSCRVEVDGTGDQNYTITDTKEITMDTGVADGGIVTILHGAGAGAGNSNLNIAGDTGTGTVDLINQTLTIAGSGATTSASNQTITVTASSISSVDSGWINTNDWTDRQLGFMEIDYDNLSSAFTVGKTITEEISGITGVIVSDDGSTLMLSNITGGGVFTNNREITESDTGYTADVNEPSGDSKNQDTNCLHSFASFIGKLSIHLYWSADGNDDASRLVTCGMDTQQNGAEIYGWGANQIDTNTIQVQSGRHGIFVMNATGGPTQIDTEDDYYRIIIMKVLL